MLHESIKVNNFVVKENAGFRLRLESWEALSPKGLFNINFIQECFDKDGNISQDSTYNFHMTKEEINNLCQGLSKIHS